MDVFAAPDWINGAPDDLRRWRNARPEVVNPTMPGDVQVSDLPPEGDCPGGLMFTPFGATGTPVVYFHGGGFIVGSPETHRVVAAWIAHVARASVLSVRYRLAPESSFPAQVEDGVAAIVRQCRLNPRLRVMGDSAGGMIALWVYAGLMPIERGAIADLVLFNPGGIVMPRPAAAGEDEADGLGPRSLASYTRRLDPAGVIAGNPRYDPFAKGFPFHPATTVLGAGADPLLYASETLADLSGARLIIAEGQTHGFLSNLPAPSSMAWLRRSLEGAE